MNEVDLNRKEKSSAVMIASKPLFSKQFKRNCVSIIRDLDHIGKVDCFVSQCINALKLNPQQRTAQDLSYITSFLDKSDLAQKLGAECLSHESLQQILVLCGTEMLYHYFPSNKILFRIGDEANKFYIIIQGRVEILKPISYVEKITGFEYFHILLDLYKKNEKYLLNETIESNYKVFPIDITDMPLLPIIVLDILLDGYEYETNLKRKTFLDVIHSCNIDILQESSIKLEEDDDDIIEDIVKWLEVYLAKVKFINHDIYKDLKNKISKYELTLYRYHSFLQLENGAFFGDAALDKKTTRNATIKTMEDTHFCSLDIHNYNSFLFSEKRKLVNKEIFFLVNSFFFKKISPSYFERRYFNFFINEELCKGDYLFHENSPVECIFFLKSGLVELTINKNVFELHSIIKYLGQLLIQDKNEENPIDMQNDIGKDMIQELAKRIQYHLFTVNDKESFGADCFFFGINFLYTGRVLSEKAKIYKIYLKDLLRLINLEPVSYESLHWHSKNKIKALKLRLIDLRNVSLGMVNQKLKENKIIKEKIIDKINKPKHKYKSPGCEIKHIKTLSFNQTASTMKKSSEIETMLPSILNSPLNLKRTFPKNESNLITFQQSNTLNEPQSIDLKKNQKPIHPSKLTIENSHFGLLNETRLLNKLKKEFKRQPLFFSTDFYSLGNSTSQKKIKLDDYSSIMKGFKPKFTRKRHKNNEQKLILSTEIDRHVMTVVSMMDIPIDYEEPIHFHSSKIKFSGKFFQEKKNNYRLFKSKIYKQMK